MFPQDSAGFGFAYKAHPAAHIEIRVGGCNAVDGPKDKPDVELFFLGPLSVPVYAAGRQVHDLKSASSIVVLTVVILRLGANEDAILRTSARCSRSRHIDGKVVR